MPANITYHRWSHRIFALFAVWHDGQWALNSFSLLISCATCCVVVVEELSLLLLLLNVLQLATATATHNYDIFSHQQDYHY